MQRWRDADCFQRDIWHQRDMTTQKLISFLDVFCWARVINYGDFIVLIEMEINEI